MNRFLYVLVSIAFLLTSNVEIFAGNSNNTEFLFTLINNRFTYMKDVAAYKFKNNIPIDDTQREVVVLSEAIKRAEQEGLSSDSVRGFYRLQIELSKSIQNEWINLWKKTGFPNDYPIKDLKKDIRPKLDNIDREIIKAIKLNVKNLSDNEIQEYNKDLILKTINVEYLPDRNKLKLLKALSSIKDL